MKEVNVSVNTRWQSSLLSLAETGRLLSPPLVTPRDKNLYLQTLPQRTQYICTQRGSFIKSLPVYTFGIAFQLKEIVVY